MFEVWMMTTNFLICVAAVLGTALAVVKKEPDPPKCQCNGSCATLRCLNCMDDTFRNIPRAVLTRQDATVNSNY